MRAFGLLALLVVLAFVLAFSATTYLRGPSGGTYNAARNAAERAAGAASTRAGDMLKVPAAP